ncbi:MAG: UDP-N-acetylmuramoyl-L-alanine--D-glutamate ligase [Sphingomonadales bacterium]
MIRSSTLSGKKVGVFGLGRSGFSAVRSLEAGGASVYAWDDNLVNNINTEIPLKNLYNIDLHGFGGLVVAPGISLTHPKPHPLVIKAKESGVDIFGDIEIFGRSRAKLPPHQVVGVTGTNGKSTTTALLAHVLGECGFSTLASGNIGLPVLEQDPLPDGGVYVFELSSFQLDLTKSLKPEYAILLNLTPDHLDRHGDMAGYVKAKSKLFEMQGKDGVAIINVDDASVKAVGEGLSQTVIPISIKGRIKGGYYVRDGHVLEAIGNVENDLGEIPYNTSLLGEHNWQNILCVIAVAHSMGTKVSLILKAIKSYKGLEHRLEKVDEREGIIFINDSKATNSAATSKALGSFKNIYWIAGGLYKEETLDGLNESLGSVKKAYFIGKDVGMLSDWAENKIVYEKSITLDVAFKNALEDAMGAKGGVILLSPACASYDQFKNYTERGNDFKNLVLNSFGGGSV